MGQQKMNKIGEEMEANTEPQLVKNGSKSIEEPSNRFLADLPGDQYFLCLSAFEGFVGVLVEQ